MSNEHIQELLGRYATGALTEQERAVLFEAALEDQSLFEQLAAEHELKGLLEQPGARERMLRALAPAPALKSWGWLGIAGSAAAVGVAAMVGVALLRAPAPKQIAQVHKEFAVPAGAAPALAPAPPIIQSAAPVLKGPKQALSLAPAAQPEPAIAGVPPPPPGATDVKESVARLGTPVAPQAQPMAAPGVAGFRTLNQFAQVAPNGFGFSYTVTADDKLRLTPTAMGFVTVRGANGTATRNLAQNFAAQARSMSEFKIPEDITILTVIFSARPVPPGEVQAGLGGALDGLSGTKADPNPSPDSRLTAIIPIKPGAVR
ncbi:MAG: hypothetical protein JO307_17840 [Bryobacterales bacterium]|nr:hypothetical protein [Bryobacterales bacterium]MBV9397090.1 hypothetical protein [Bryobacterales bacterium]